METLAQHVKKRGYERHRYNDYLDENENILVTLLWNLSGKCVGYQNYRRAHDKKKKNNETDGKYYTYHSPSEHAVFGLESLAWFTGPILITEGMFDAACLHDLNFPALGLLMNDPKELANWLVCLGRPIIAIMDGDSSCKLNKYAHHAIRCPEGLDINDLYMTDRNHPVFEEIRRLHDQAR